MASKLSAQEINQFQENILNWYNKNARVLPWRSSNNPYYVWISEVMLQQTQVKTVLPYYENFTKKYPKMADFAAASEENILKMWEGLGYYSRVKNFQAGCKQVIEQFSGEIPKNKKELLTIKGIGDYTAGALLSICYNLPVPAVDGNVYRIYGRVFQIEDDITKGKTKIAYEDIVNETMSQTHANKFNQALMDIGATVCLPKNPKCNECPINDFCKSYKNDTIHNYPVKSGKTKSSDVYLIVIILKTDTNKYVIQKRPKSGLLSDFYMYLTFESEIPYDDKVQYINMNTPVNINLNKNSLGNVKHIFSHKKWNIDVYSGNVREKDIKDDTMKLVTEKQMEKFPFPVPYQKAWKIYKDSTKNNLHKYFKSAK